VRCGSERIVVRPIFDCLSTDPFDAQVQWKLSLPLMVSVEIIELKNKEGFRIIMSQSASFYSSI
jgi:hypothetical protein